MRVLIVDGEPDPRRALRTALQTMEHAVDEAASGPGALKLVERRAYDVTLVDLRLGRDSVLGLLEALRVRCPRLAVVVIAAPDRLETVVEAMRRGAVDYLPKPFTPDQIRATLERAIQMRRMCDRVADLEDQVRAEVPVAELDHPDPLEQKVLSQARLVAPSDAVVLIRGEGGTGKGVLARSLHDWSKRANGPFVTVSCPSLSPDLLESDLFGHARGASTDAVREAGKVARAEGGTLFLDEIGDLPPTLQPKLLRLLQERQYERVGELVSRTADVRVVASTNRDLETAVAAGSFRQDLLYRLNVIELILPPLRHRSDIGALADHLLAFFARQTGRRLTSFTPEARAALDHYHWPGNIRELRNAVERAAILAPGPEVGLADLPERIMHTRVGAAGTIEVGRRVSLERIEVEHIRQVLASTSSLEEAAQVLMIDPSTLYRKRKRIGL